MAASRKSQTLQVIYYRGSRSLIRCRRWIRANITNGTIYGFLHCCAFICIRYHHIFFYRPFIPIPKWFYLYTTESWYFSSSLAKLNDWIKLELCQYFTFFVWLVNLRYNAIPTMANIPKWLLAWYLARNMLLAKENPPRQPQTIFFCLNSDFFYVQAPFQTESNSKTPIYTIDSEKIIPSKLHISCEWVFNINKMWNKHKFEHRHGRLDTRASYSSSLLIRRTHTNIP